MNNSKYIFDDITIKEVIGQCLKKWRRILVLAFIFAFLFGVYRITSIVKTVNTYKGYSEEEIAIVADGINESISSLEERIEKEEAYIDNSIILNFDSSNVALGTMLYYIDTPVDDVDVDYAKDILYAYSSMFINEEIFNTIANLYDNEVLPEYFRGAISFKMDLINDVNCMEITIKHHNELQAEELMNMVCKAIEIEANNINKSVGEFVPVLQYKNVNLIVDASVLDYKNTAKGGLKALNDDLNKKEKELDNVNIYLNPKSSIVRILLFIALGFVVGVVASFLYYASKICISSNVKSANQLSINYGLNVVADVNIMSKINAIDKLAYKLTQEKLSLSFAERADYVVYNIEHMTKTDNIVLINMTKTAIKEDLEKAVKKSNKKISILNYYDEDTFELDKLSESREVIVLAKKFENSLSQIEREIRVIESFDKEFIGVVLV